MARDIEFDEGSEVILSASNVDDGAGIFVDGNKIVHVNFNGSGSTTLKMVQGHSYVVKFELWNMTGGAYHGIFRIRGIQAGKKAEPFHHDRPGQSGPMPVVWQETVVLRPRKWP
jgi:hypothetical protein